LRDIVSCLLCIRKIYELSGSQAVLLASLQQIFGVSQNLLADFRNTL